MIRIFKQAGIRTSIFVDPVVEMVEGAVETGTDRIELYTEGYARHFPEDKEKAVGPYVQAAKRAKELGLGINAGHDLDLHNLGYFSKQIPFLDEVSIGHALICDAIYLGLENTISFAKEDCLNLSFQDESFDAVTAAFGIRNFQNLDQGLKEMCRVLKKGGHLCIVELTTPVSFPMKQLFSIYSNTVLPMYGKLISKDQSAYSYLNKTIEAFPQGEVMMEVFKKAGFAKAEFKRLTFGICTLYFATK